MLSRLPTGCISVFDCETSCKRDLPETILNKISTAANNYPCLCKQCPQIAPALLSLIILCHMYEYLSYSETSIIQQGKALRTKEMRHCQSVICIHL